MTTTTFNEDEEKYFLRLSNHKPLWRDRSLKGPDTISNSISLQPIKALSSYHLWIKRNLLLISETDQYLFVSGSNLILEDFNSKKQKIIPIRNDCNVTSLSFQTISTNEKVIVVGEKVFPNEDKKYDSGCVEIINLDNKIIPKRLILDLSVFVDYDSYVFDAIISIKGDICFVVLKKLLNDEPKSKIFAWNFVSSTIVAIEEFPYHIEGISRNPFKLDSFIVFSPIYSAIWEFNLEKKGIFLEQEFHHNEEEDIKQKFAITDSRFIIYKEKHGVCISFKNHWFEIFFQEVEEETNNTSYVLFIKTNIIDYIDSNLINIEIKKDENDLEDNNFNDNLVKNDNIIYSNNLTSEKVSLKAENSIKYVISRGKFILIFFLNSPLIIVLEFFEDEENKTKLRIKSVEKLEHKVSLLCRVAINIDMSRLLLVSGDSIFKFYSLLSAKRGSKIGIHKTYFNLQNVKLNFYKYKISYIDDCPNFIFEKQLLPYTSRGYPVKQLLFNEVQKIIILTCGNDNEELYFYKQIDNGSEEIFSKQKIGDVPTPNYIKIHSQYYKNETDINFLFYKKLEEKPLNMSFSPIGNEIFISYKENGYLYALMENEMKEIFKVNMYCRASIFNSTGTYLAFSTSEYENDFNINILNLENLEYEFIITKVPQPTKLSFIDGNRILIAQFNDNNINLLGWKLTPKMRLFTPINNGTKEKLDKDSEVDETFIAVKIVDFSGNILDYCYDQALQHCLITSGDKRVRVYKGFKEGKLWEFPSDIEYPCCILIKKYDTIVFGTKKGTLRICIWPISTLLKDSNAMHPDYSEIYLHVGEVTSLVLSKDEKFLYSSGKDGSVFVSCVTGMTNDVPVNFNNFIYFNPKNILPKKMYYNYQDVMYITDNIYQGKIDEVAKVKNNIQGLISEFTSNKEKLIQGNSNILEEKRGQLTRFLEEKVKAVKEKGTEKEKLTKRLKEERENQIKNIKDQLNTLKNEFKNKKEKKQIETIKLINCIKIAKEKFNQKKTEIETMRNKTNTNILNSLETMYKLLQDKKLEIDKAIVDRKNKFKQKCEKNENYYENDLREKEKNFKISLEEFEIKDKETENEINKKNKDNKNYDEKISEWDHHLKELKTNNEELMETYIFNTLKLNQMNQLLSENESKISVKEKIVKDKRLINDRLEQLRFVLEYQIKNLILEKTPIEEQIKNFETLHSDFYKRFNSLYAELLKINELIENNQNCIVTYRDELAETKKRLYQLKNLYKAIDVELNSILKSKLQNKKEIMKQIFNVYQEYLKNFSEVRKQEKDITQEMRLQQKNIEKEIYHQKNNVLRELIEKRSERKKINKEKEEMTNDIRLDNQLLIQECSNIRENLDEISKNIKDIEKKYLELKSSSSNK